MDYIDFLYGWVLTRARSCQFVKWFIIFLLIDTFSWIHDDLFCDKVWKCSKQLRLLSRGGRNSGLSGSCVSFLRSTGRSLGLPSSKQTPRLRPLQGESWGLLGYDQEETYRKWADAFMPLNAKLPKRLPCQCGVSSKSTEPKQRLYHRWLKVNICVLFW